MIYYYFIQFYLCLGLAGKNEWERAQVNEIVDFLNDVRKSFADYVYVALGFREGDKVNYFIFLINYFVFYKIKFQKKLRETVYVPNREKFFPILENLLKESNSGFLVSTGVTFVDFLFADTLDLWNSFEPTVYDGFPLIGEFVKRVLDLPQLKKYLTQRKN